MPLKNIVHQSAHLTKKQAAVQNILTHLARNFFFFFFLEWAQIKKAGHCHNRALAGHGFIVKSLLSNPLLFEPSII